MNAGKVLISRAVEILLLVGVHSRFEVPFGLLDKNKSTFLTKNFVHQMKLFIIYLIHRFPTVFA